MEMKHIEVNPVRRVVCGAQEMSDSEAVTTIVRLGSEVDRLDAGDCAQHGAAVSGRWVGHGQALPLLGPPGVGKTHLAVALGREAVERDYTVLFNSAVGHLFFQLVSRRYKRADQQQPAGRRRFPEAPEGVGRPDPG